MARCAVVGAANVAAVTPLKYLESVPKFIPPAVTGKKLFEVSSSSRLTSKLFKIKLFPLVVPTVIVALSSISGIFVSDVISELAPEAAALKLLLAVAAVVPAVPPFATASEVPDHCELLTVESVAKLPSPRLVRAVATVPKSDKLLAAASAPTCVAVVACGLEVFAICVDRSELEASPASVAVWFIQLLVPLS